MSKTLFRRMLLFLAACILLYSCRIEDEMIAEKNSNSNARKFKALTSKNGEPVNYSHGFKYLLERYDKLHNTQLTRKTVMKNNKFAGKNIPEFIEFNIHSQDLIRNDGKERWIMYPVIKNGEVSGIAIAVLKEEETNLQFYKLDEDGDYYKEVIGLFRTQYNNSIIKEGMNKNSERCGFEGEEPCDIKEVIIRVPGNGPGGNQGMYKPRDWGAGGGYCDTYGNCGGEGGNDDGGGGPPEPPTDSTKTPCAKMKAQTNSSIFKSNITALEGKTNDTYESGYRISNTGQNQLLQNKPGTRQVDLKAFSNTVTLMHSHYDGLYPMFSPGDVIFFNQWIVWAQNWNAVATNNPKIPLNNLTFTLVTSNGNYSFNFDGTSTTPFPNYTDQEIDDLNDKYIRLVDEAKTVGNVSGNISYDMQRLEKQFLKFMANNTNMSGLKLFRTTDSGNTELSLNTNGTLKETNCP